MKQLIPQSKIDKALDKAYSSTKENAYFGSGFNQGVQFALNEIQPLMVEFTRFCSTYIHNFLKQKKNFSEYKSIEQLLEEFINYKNK